MNSQKFHRTMEEAFGPGNRGGIYTSPDPLHPADKIILIGSAVAAVSIIVMVLV